MKEPVIRKCYRLCFCFTVANFTLGTRKYSGMTFKINTPMKSATSSTSIDVKDVALFIGVFILNVIPLYFLVPKVKLATVK